jgi:hypothetical protein
MGARWLGCISLREIPYPPSVLLRDWILSVLFPDHVLALDGTPDYGLPAPGLFETFGDTLTTPYNERVRTCKAICGKYSTFSGAVYQIVPAQVGPRFLFDPPPEALQRFHVLFGEESDFNERSAPARRRSLHGATSNSSAASISVLDSSPDIGKAFLRRSASFGGYEDEQSWRLIAYQEAEMSERINATAFLSAKNSAMSELELRRYRHDSLLRLKRAEILGDLTPGNSLKSTFDSVLHLRQ